MIGIAKECELKSAQFNLLLPEEGPEWFRKEFEDYGGVIRCNPALRGNFRSNIVNEVIKELKVTRVLLMFYPMFALSSLSIKLNSSVSAMYYLDQSSQVLENYKGIKSIVLFLRGRLFSLVYKKIITVSDFKCDKLRECLSVPRNKLRVIYNGVSFETLINKNVTANRDDSSGVSPGIFFAGQVAEYKGIRTLVEVYLDLLRSNPEIPDLYIAGEGPLKQPLYEYVQSGKLGNRVHFLGHRSDVSDLMQAAQMIIIPSEWDEACAFVAIEAMAAGRPLIVSDAGSLPDLVGDLATIYPRGDKAALKSSILKLLKNPQANKMGPELKKRALRKFDIHRTIQEYVQEITAV